MQTDDEYIVVLKGRRARAPHLAIFNFLGYELIQQERTSDVVPNLSNTLFKKLAGKFTIYELWVAMKTANHIYIYSKSNPPQEVAIRIEKNNVRIAFIGKNRNGYLVISTRTFNRISILKSAWLFSSIDKLLELAEDKQLDCIEHFIPQETANVYTTLAAKLEWSWRTDIVSDE